MRGVILVVLLYATQAHAEIYQCIDKYGRVAFQPAPCEPSSQSSKKIELKGLLEKQNRHANPHPDNTILNKNLLQNPAFGHAFDHWATPADVHWLEGAGFRNSGVLQMAARKPPQDKYIHETVVSQCVPIENGTMFSLGGRFRHEGRPLKQHANRMRVIWYESLDCTSGGQFGWFIEPRDVTGWQLLRHDKLKPALSAKAAKVEIMQNGRHSNNAKGYWDNVYLMATELSAAPGRQPGYVLPAGFDFIENGDFRRDVKGWHRGWPNTWSGSTGNHGVGAARVTASSNKGSIGRGALQQCVNFGASQRFHVGASFKHGDTSTQQGSARLRVTWYEKGDCRGRAKTDLRWIDPETDKTGWQALRLDNMKAAKGSISAKVELIQSILGSGTYHAYWDDVYFITAE
jgi:hypothetical protein